MATPFTSAYAPCVPFWKMLIVLRDSPVWSESTLHTKRLPSPWLTFTLLKRVAVEAFSSINVRRSVAPLPRQMCMLCVESVSQWLTLWSQTMRSSAAPAPTFTAMRRFIIIGTRASATFTICRGTLQVTPSATSATNASCESNWQSASEGSRGSKMGSAPLYIYVCARAAKASSSEAAPKRTPAGRGAAAASGAGTSLAT